MQFLQEEILNDALHVMMFRAPTKNCILCHVDNDGIKATNPKTHVRNFRSDLEDGDWHTDRGSVCYSCHTDANARPEGTKGIGFCGYCHK